MFREKIRIFKKKRIWIPLSFIIIAILIWAGYQAVWTDFQTKSLWHWLELLIIPIVLAAGALLFQRAERTREINTAKERERVDHELARERQRQEALLTYFDGMENLLLQRKLRKSKEGSEVRTIARARTLFIFRNLDGQRKRYALQFLYESDLIKSKIKEKPIIDLKGANLKGAHLEGAWLNFANIYEAHLEGANLEEAWFNAAIMSGAHLEGAHLEGAWLNGAIMNEAHLEGAHLKGAYLEETVLRWAHLEGANLEGANLTNAMVTPEQLAEAKDLRGATMPDGTKYEEWVKGGKPDWNKAD